MAVATGTAISAGTQLVGLISGKGGRRGGGDSTARDISRLFRETIEQVRQDDPTERIRAGFDAARSRTREDAETVLGNVFSRFAQAGSTPDLPDTARASTIRGTTADIFRDLELAQAQAESTSFERMLQNRLSVLQTGQAGRGKVRQPTNQFNVGAFANTIGDVLDQSGVRL